MARAERLTWGVCKDPDSILRILTRFAGTPARRVPGSFDACTAKIRCLFRHAYVGTRKHYCTAPSSHECAHQVPESWPGPAITVSGERGDAPFSDDDRTRECIRAIQHHSHAIALRGDGDAALAAQVLWGYAEWGDTDNIQRMNAQTAHAAEVAKRIEAQRLTEAEARKRVRQLRGSND